MKKLHGHTLEYWKNNAEEDYLKVPISVLKYITCLEERIEQLTIPVVVSSKFLCGKEKQHPLKRCEEQCGWCEGDK
tara:strand:- start:143 stop:370 length:228 start_codon:yes stop_codon:yes gene_type:complete